MTLRSVSCIAVCRLFGAFAVPTRSQTVDDVRREIDQLKKDYEAGIKALEDRLASLEKDQTATKQDVPATKQTVERTVRDAVDAVVAGTAETSKAASKIASNPWGEPLR